MLNSDSVELTIPTVLEQHILELYENHAGDHMLSMIKEKINLHSKEESVSKVDEIGGNGEGLQLTFKEVIYIWKHYPLEGVYLHELLEEVQVNLPRLQPLSRDPVLEARCQKLREQADLRSYQTMVKGISGQVGRQTGKTEESFGQEMQAVNRQLTVIFNTVLTVVCSAVFGFLIPPVLLGYTSAPIQLTLALAFGLVVLMADLYFIVRTERKTDKEKSS